MTPIRSFSLALALVAAGVAGFAIAAPSTPDGRARGECAGRCADGMQLAHGRRGGRLAQAIQDDPAVAVIVNLRAIERVYRQEGRAAEVPAFYRAQLERTQDPLVRNFVNYRLARLELREDDAKAALEALTRNLDENYRRL
jgi:hypothetical protein